MVFDARQVALHEAARLDDALRAAAERARSEEDFRIAAVAGIAGVAERHSLRLDLRAEMAIASGRADAAYNRVVIEFERPGVMRASREHGGTAHAISQVEDYLAGLAAEVGVSPGELAGVATDGHWYVFVRSVGGEWVHDGPHARNATTTARLLRILLSLGTGRALTPENLVEDFGLASSVAPVVVGGLYSALTRAHPGGPLRDALFEEWERLFAAISGIDESAMDDRARRPLLSLIKRAGLQDVQPSKLLFCIHTYFALVAKLVAYSAVGRHTMPIGLGLGDWAGLDDATLVGRVRTLEDGGLFRAAGLRNFLEGDFFGWYVVSWTADVVSGVREIASALSEYDPGSVEARPELTRDLLKGLYQYLMPPVIRHDLGEYYTPDWLASLTLDRAEFTGEAGQRLLDPACGSGTFLVLAIARVKAASELEAPRALLARILNDVVGFDLNPLAVIAARANYVLALGDLLAHRNSEIEVPIYLADSVHPPAPAPGLFGGTFPLTLGRETFTLPSWVSNAGTVESLTNALEEAVAVGASLSAFQQRIADFAPAPQSQDDDAAIKETYERLVQLHKEGRNGVWARIMKNAFMPLFVGAFSHVVGNPPWIAWEHLSDAYRRATADLWDGYGLHPPREAMAMPSRRTRSDMAVLMTYVAADRYLRPEGRLAFVITQTVFKSEAAGRGFRRFRLRLTGDHLGVSIVDDFVDFQPFEAASNRTAVISLARGRKTEYPVPYTKWRPGAVGRVPRSDIALGVLMEGTSREAWQARPIVVTDTTSPWLTGPPAVIDGLTRVIGRVPAVLEKR